MKQKNPPQLLLQPIKVKETIQQVKIDITGLLTMAHGKRYILVCIVLNKKIT